MSDILPDPRYTTISLPPIDQTTTELSGDTAQENGDLIHGLRELQEAAHAYVQAEQYYDGTTPEWFVSSRLRRMLEQTGLDFTVRLAKIPVDAVSDRLEISAVTVPDNSELTTILQRDVWDTNELLLESPCTHLKTCMFGDSYTTVWPGDDGNVVIYYNSPLTTRIVYDEENPRAIAFAIKAWVTDEDDDDNNETRRATVYYADRIEKYITRTGRKGDKADDWVEYTDDDGVWPIDNPYGRVPVFHFRNDRPYGVPEHEAAYGPQEAINKLVSMQLTTTDYQSFPQRWALEDNDEGPSEATDFGDDDADAMRDSDDREPDQSTFKAGPGEVWWIKKVKAVGEFTTADVSAFLQPLDRYVRLMATVTHTPLHYFDPMGDSPSGEALRAKEAPLVKRVGKRQNQFASTWADLLSFAMLILGHDGVKVDVRWAAAAHVEDVDGWTVIEMKIKLGVDPKQAFMEAGYTEEQASKYAETWREIDARMALMKKPPAGGKNGERDDS